MMRERGGGVGGWRDDEGRGWRDDEGRGWRDDEGRGVER